ncbi:MBOAT family O-acyltransferase [Oribacterium sp. WCC10]|uniref:MBOAT family O-acyltransferase n=1 Tax=Oribacterium sp. WCC10 TaxID=1855343 RepID=UPI0008DEC30C|nr:MBOAT family O-acyltransferase [Oribacterium sp. WCC10]SFG75144.1 hypothetical protein/alginate O-acetyltransferase complex protein AlgI [Oribacterium sp. WCC10]
MLFSSIPFILYFFPTVLVGYYLLFFSRLLQNVWLLFASLLFYAWGEPVYVLLMISSIMVNSIVAIVIGGMKKGQVRKAVFILSVVFNIGMLFVFKYLGFVLSFFGEWGNALYSKLNISLPIGISFFTFQALSYVVDVYRGEVRPENPFYVGLYISFFPQLIAGPIVQYNYIAEQLRNRKSSIDKFSLGMCRFAAGFGKKILLANTFASLADHVFSWSQIGSDKLAVPATLAWFGSIAYSLQIYFDFSAYSDMAIGLALCFGFKLKENFNYPYIATSVTDFWKRWHISLTDWFRDYVYIPLGGNRNANKDLVVRNLLVVWTLTGIWHGANWTFIFWGLFYFILQLIERFSDFEKNCHNTLIRRTYTLITVNFLWVLFRSEDIYQAGRFYLNMFGVNNNGFLSDTAFMLLKENIFFILAGILLSTPVVPMFNKWIYEHQKSKVSYVFSFIYPVTMICMIICCISYLIIGSYNPFIYFNF